MKQTKYYFDMQIFPNPNRLRCVQMRAELHLNNNNIDMLPQARASASSAIVEQSDDHVRRVGETADDTRPCLHFEASSRRDLRGCRDRVLRTYSIDKTIPLHRRLQRVS